MKRISILMVLMVFGCNIVFAGGRGSETTLLDYYLSPQAEPKVLKAFSFNAMEAANTVTIDPQGAALVFARRSKARPV